jgi:hypothetical protein
MMTSLLIQTDTIEQFSIAVVLFYDAPSPSGVFDEFLSIPAAGRNVSTRSFFDLVQSMDPLAAYNGLR